MVLRNTQHFSTLALTVQCINSYDWILMLDRLPEHIEPSRLAEIGRFFRGRFQLRKLHRLAPLLTDTKGDMQVSLNVYIDECSVPVVEGTIEGSVNMRCQRCLEEINYPLDLKYHLGVVSSEAEIESLPQGYDPLLATGEPMKTLDIIEEEILLALPSIPLHAESDGCETGYQNQNVETTRDNPFAVLEKLKSK